MSKEIDQKISQLTLKIAGHLSNIKIKHNSLEGKYINLCKEVGELEERVRILERKVDKIVFEAVWKSLTALGGIISAGYGIVVIAKALVG